MMARQWNALVLLMIGLGLGYAWLHRHVEDDAFITFRYSLHLSQGHGPVFNPGDAPVEGYSNFLWMLLMALPHLLGMDPVLPAVLLSMACLGLNLWLLHRISLRQLADGRAAFWAWLPVACSHTLLFFSTSGLETSLNALLWTLALWLLQGFFKGKELPSARRLLSLGLVAGLATLCRMEGLLLSLACLGALAAIWFVSRQGRWGRLGLFLLGMAALVLPWEAWRLSFYGEWLPNTFHIKAGSGSLLHGLRHLGIFVAASGAWVAWIVLAVARQPRKLDFDLFGMSATVLCGCFLAYVALVGGDYLEFRLLSPVLPLVLMLPLWRLERKARHRLQLPVAAAGMVILAFLWGQGHGRWFRLAHLNAVVHPVADDTRFLSFTAQGKALGELLGRDSSLRMAIGACGAIPYYSGFYAIDLYGLNESFRTFDSYETGYGPGHARLATWAFTVGRAPHLISLRCERPQGGDRHYTLGDPQIAELGISKTDTATLDRVRIVELPLGDGFVETCIYWREHPAVEGVIKNKSLTIYRLED